MPLYALDRPTTNQTSHDTEVTQRVCQTLTQTQIKPTSIAKQWIDFPPHHPPHHFLSFPIIIIIIIMLGSCLCVVYMQAVESSRGMLIADKDGNLSTQQV